MILLENVSKKYGNATVIKNVDLYVRKKEFVLILGPNGAGKSTLLKLMAGLTSPSPGTIRVDDRDISKDCEGVRGMIGVISHESYLYNDLTAWENLLFFGHIYGLSGNELEDRIEKLLDRVGLLHRSYDRVSTFSRGMKQRLSICRALIHNPSIVLLDEPYTGLDQRSAAMFEEVLLGLDSLDTTRVMISHDIERGLRLCDRVVILVEGRIVFEGTTCEIDDVEKFKQLYLSLVESPEREIL